MANPETHEDLIAIMDRFATWYYCQCEAPTSEWYERLTAQVVTDLENVLGRERLEQLQGNSMAGSSGTCESEER